MVARGDDDVRRERARRWLWNKHKRARQLARHTFSPGNLTVELQKDQGDKGGAEPETGSAEIKSNNSNTDTGTRTTHLECFCLPGTLRH